MLTAAVLRICWPPLAPVSAGAALKPTATFPPPCGTLWGRTQNRHMERRGAKFHVDLAGLNRQWLLRAGLAPEHIEVSGVCTACRPDLFWSHRKMGDQRGVQAAVIALKECL